MNTTRGYQKIPYSAAREMLRDLPLCDHCSREYCLRGACIPVVAALNCEVCRAAVGLNCALTLGLVSVPAPQSHADDLMATLKMNL